MPYPAKNQRNAEICDDYRAGISVPDLAQKHRVSRQRIYAILKKGGVRLNQPKGAGNADDR